eukprot:scaffold655_cov379-Prasinococcus_capsulatus_cf.AAC.16
MAGDRPAGRTDEPVGSTTETPQTLSEREARAKLGECMLKSTSGLCCTVGVLLAIPIGLRLKALASRGHSRYLPILYLGMGGTAMDVAMSYYTCAAERDAVKKADTKPKSKNARRRSIQDAASFGLRRVRQEGADGFVVGLASASVTSTGASSSSLTLATSPLDDMVPPWLASGTGREQIERQRRQTRAFDQCLAVSSPLAWRPRSERHPVNGFAAALAPWSHSRSLSRTAPGGAVHPLHSRPTRDGPYAPLTRRTSTGQMGVQG